jgi:hypothetical protein
MRALDDGLIAAYRDDDRYPKNASRVTKGGAEAEAHAASLCETRWFVILPCRRRAP